MDRIAENDSILIRKMEENDSDFCIFLKWMTDPETMKYWEGMTVHYTYDKVVKEYQEILADQVTPCVIEYQQKAIGFCQFCVLDAEVYEVPKEEYERFVIPSDVVYGIDIFLGEVQYRDRGIGTKCLKLLMEALFDKYGADVLMIDPKTHNQRAIACYHKCGFTDYFVVPQRELQDEILHDSLIMGARKEAVTL